MSGKSSPPGYTWCGEKGDLSLYLTHVKFDGDSAEHPALYVRNEHRRVDKRNPITGQAESGCPAWLLPYREFWIFRPEDDARVNGIERLHDMTQRLANASVALYGLDVPAYRFRIHDAVLEFADDVKNLRPPPGLTAEAWRAQLEHAGVRLRVNGEQVS